MWISELLRADHDCSLFDSGQVVLDHWLRSEALRMQQQDVARTYVWSVPEDATVAAYFSISPTQIAAQSVSRGISGGHTVVPGYLLGRLALQRGWQGQGLGGQLLRDALERCVSAAQMSAGRVVVVDPIDEAARAFYRRNGFTEAKAPDGRMIVKIATIRKSLGL